MLCYYFSALTPVHFLFHSQEEKCLNQCDDHWPSHANEDFCSLCDIILSGQNVHLSADFLQFDFSLPIIFSEKEKATFHSDYHSLSTTQYFLLRAPPV